MKLYDFLILSEEEQFNTIWNLGTHVDNYIKDNVAINLYIINDFFAEVYYNIENNTILYKKIFKQGELLDKYLNNINL